VADAAGYFLVYLSSELAYDIVVKSADDSITYQSRTVASNIAGAQPVDATLTALAGLTIADGDYIEGTGVDTFRTRKLMRATYAALTAIGASARFDGMLVYVSARTTAGDGGEGWWRFDSASSATANGGTILAPDAGTGRWLRQSNEYVDGRWFGALGDGTTNDTAAIQAAIDSLGASGGKVIIPNTMRCLIDTALTVKPNVSLVGPHEFVGSPADNSSAPYGSVGGALLINSSVTITLMGGSTVAGLLVHRKGMTFPASTASAFAGTAFTAGDDDCGVERCMILGFAQAFSSVNFPRPRFRSVSLDCIAGIYVENCLDNPVVENCHAWPYAGIAEPSKPSDWADRSGVAFYFKNTADWLTLRSCFSYGYLTGVKIENCNSYLLIAPQCDGTGTYANSLGIDINGTAGGCEEGMIIAPRCAAQTLTGIRINTLAGVPTTIIGGGVWETGTHGVLLTAGDLHISDTVIRDVSNGITINSASSRVFRSRVRFDTVTLPLNVTVSTSNVFGGEDDTSVSMASANVVNATIASADPLPILTVGNAFNVSGTTSFGGLNEGWTDREVTLIFSGILSVFSSTGAATAMRLSGASTYTSSAGSTLTLRHNGVQWYEVGRSA
jgi:hypothetical protein